MTARTLCHLHELPDGLARGFDPGATGQTTMLVLRRGRQLRAFLDRCPHHGTPLAWRADAYLNAAGDRIVCAAHGALFDTDTGACTLGPCLGQGLTPVAVRLGPHDQVQIDEPHSPIQETSP
ncbi:Rieske (2Fe-2S) protein [Sphaerotilus natans]|uniref:Rieske (2Fe-2S) protein n=1 Tax=Sphaerotilus natans TaxID=34103 RepID=UPI00406C8372